MSGTVSSAREEGRQGLMAVLRLEDVAEEGGWRREEGGGRRDDG